MNRPTLYVFAKQARRGRAKTRLARGIGETAALAFQRACLAATLRELARGPWRLVLCGAPDAAARSRRLWPSPVPRRGQGRGDLGARMARALAAARGPVAIVGSDIPDIRRAHVRAAFAALGGADFVFGRSRDGGYWLVGARIGARARRVFRGVRWSSAHALADSLASLGRARVAFAATLDDVDERAGYERWLRPSPSVSS
ncbi:MAG: TIGR04282 family arsenosugar biosynthesis glycosyltransferase [Azospirillum sp.]|nr:TIGR04282 family arsenosugar biosynthesis glycosyltransferase [Azospirillum sp.]